jgi:hypothetical protein
MAKEIITMEDLETFRLKLLDDIKALLQPVSQAEKKWLKSGEVRKLLGISHGTLQNLRIRGTIPFRKIGGITYYKYEDIFNLLEKGGHMKGQSKG